jgi:hypothetical protein
LRLHSWLRRELIVPFALPAQLKASFNQSSGFLGSGASASSRFAARLCLRDHPASIMSRIRVMSASMAKGFVTICMPGLRRPFATTAFSA